MRARPVDVRLVARPRPRPRRGDPEDTARRIVAAAARVFNDEGFFGTDSNAIARAAGYSPGAFYKHFRDKTEVFIAAYHGWVKDVWRSVEVEGTEAVDRDRVRVRAAILHVVDIHRAWSGFRRDLRYLTASDARVRRAHDKDRRAQLARLTALVARAREPSRARARAMMLMLAVERAADAIGDGEAARLDVDAAALVDAAVDVALLLRAGA